MSRLTLLVVCVLSLCAYAFADPEPCHHNTTLAFIVDTSVSTDDVATTMRAALDQVANKNGAVLSFQDYMLSTWGFMPNDVKHFPTIQQLQNFFITDPNAAFNVRVNTVPPPQHDDWAYMLISLDIAVDNAADYGMIVVLGDEDELCDGRPHVPDGTCFGSGAYGGDWYGGQYCNTPYNDMIPSIMSKAAAKHLRISFFYFVKPALPNGQPNPDSKYGCPIGSSNRGNREVPVGYVMNISAATGGVAIFNSDTIAQNMSLEIKIQGKQPSVCPSCSDDPTLAIIVDTSSTDTVRVKQQVMDIFTQLNQAHTNGFLKSFDHYFLASWATPTVQALSFQTFTDMYAAVQDPNFYLNNLAYNATNPMDKSNDWLFLSYNLKEMINHVGVNGYIVVLSDTDAFCDAGRYSADVWTQDLQEVLNVAITKQISISWYMFDDGMGGDESAQVIHTCAIDPIFSIYKDAKGRADAMSVITAAPDNLNIPYYLDGAHHAEYLAAIGSIASNIVTVSQRISCKNCTVNATLGFLVDTSISADDLKSSLKWTFNQIGGMATQLAGFSGGFVLNTYELAFNQFLTFHSVAAMAAYVQAAQLAANRVVLDNPSHNHDDWRYMLETLPLLVAKVGKNGDVVILADDNQICEALNWKHNSSEPLFVQAVSTARQLGVKISYVQLATANHWCQPAEMIPGQGLAWILANQTGGFTFFTVDETKTKNDIAASVFPWIQAEGARPVCAEVCPVGQFWAIDHCIPANPCDVVPCDNNAICIPDGPFTTTYTCNCTGKFYGPKCQYECVPHSTSNVTRHALGMVLDTSDSTAFAINSMKTALLQVVAATSFDEYLLSTWAYVAPQMVKSFATPADVIAELNDANAGKNERTKQDSGLATHNDWKYMLDSVNAMLPLMGENGVLLIVTDFEAVCDANQDARKVAGVPRYPMNPNEPEVLALNALAAAKKIKIFFFTFPSSDYGWCNATQKTDVGLKEAYKLVHGEAGNPLPHETGGFVPDVPAFLSGANTQAMLDELKMVVWNEMQATRCDCEAPFTFDATHNYCKL